MTPLQTIAKSIYEARNGRGCVAWGKLARSHQEPYLGDARASLEGLKVPSEGMIEAGWRAVQHAPFDLAWPAMIDAAIKEG